MTQGYRTRVTIGRDWHGQTRAARKLPPGAPLQTPREQRAGFLARLVRAIIGAPPC